MDVKCDQPISDPQGYVLNNQFMGYGGAMNADGKGFNFAISFPAWGPNSPIAIQFSYVGEKIPVCTFNRQMKPNYMNVDHLASSVSGHMPVSGRQRGK
jgi:hypothetical protein